MWLQDYYQNFSNKEQERDALKLPAAPQKKEAPASAPYLKKERRSRLRSIFEKGAAPPLTLFNLRATRRSASPLYRALLRPPLKTYMCGVSSCTSCGVLDEIIGILFSNSLKSLAPTVCLHPRTSKHTAWMRQSKLNISEVFNLATLFRRLNNVPSRVVS